MSKPTVISVISQKGGVGKSTLCQLIAREATIGGKHAKILDFDIKQMSSIEWVRTRIEQDIYPAVEAEPAKDINKAVRHNKSYDIIVLDGAAGTPKRSAELASASDMIVVPTGPSRADLVPGLALARCIADMGLTGDGPVFALCRVTTAIEAAEARTAIHDAGFEILEGELVERPSYRQAQNVGRSPTETPFPSLNARARRLARSILDRVAWNAIVVRR